MVGPAGDGSTSARKCSSSYMLASGRRLCLCFAMCYDLLSSWWRCAFERAAVGTSPGLCSIGFLRLATSLHIHLVRVNVLFEVQLAALANIYAGDLAIPDQRTRAVHVDLPPAGL